MKLDLSNLKNLEVVCFYSIVNINNIILPSNIKKIIYVGDINKQFIESYKDKINMDYEEYSKFIDSFSKIDFKIPE
jgi:hypothetical protein